MQENDVTRDVLNAIESARENGDFDSVKRLSKRELENPQSDIDPLLIMDQIAHMYLDSFLIWLNEMKKINKNVDKHTVLRKIADNLENNPDILQFYTRFMQEMIDASAEEVRNKFLCVDADIEKAKEILKGEGL